MTASPEFWRSSTLRMLWLQSSAMNFAASLQTLDAVEPRSTSIGADISRSLAAIIRTHHSDETLLLASPRR